MGLTTLEEKCEWKRLLGSTTSMITNEINRLEERVQAELKLSKALNSL